MKFRIVRDSKSIQVCLLPDVKIADFDSMKHYKIHRALLQPDISSVVGLELDEAEHKRMPMVI
jgi:hypothetical protein